MQINISPDRLSAWPELTHSSLVVTFLLPWMLQFLYRVFLKPTVILVCRFCIATFQTALSRLSARFRAERFHRSQTPMDFMPECKLLLSLNGFASALMPTSRTN